MDRKQDEYDELYDGDRAAIGDGEILLNAYKKIDKEIMKLDTGDAEFNPENNGLRECLHTLHGLLIPLSYVASNSSAQKQAILFFFQDYSKTDQCLNMAREKDIFTLEEVREIKSALEDKHTALTSQGHAPAQSVNSDFSVLEI